MAAAKSDPKRAESHDNNMLQQEETDGDRWRQMETCLESLWI